MPEQMELDLETPLGGALRPRISALRVDDVLEGVGGKAFPRPLVVVGIEREDGNRIRILFRERIGPRHRFGSFVAHADDEIEIAPPF